MLLTACGGWGSEEVDLGVTSIDVVQKTIDINNLQVESLSADEEADLMVLREEEKVARDAYLKMHEVYEIDIFINIADAEQSYTDAVKIILDKYLIADPVTDDTVGLFTNLGLQAIYDALVTAGSQSLEAAIKVGVEIEELGINGIRIFRERTDKEDILSVYDSLEKGSRNHLRSFWKLLTDNGYSYTPKHLSQEAFDAIVNLEMETG